MISQPKTFIVRDCACCSDQPTVPPDCPACKGAGGFTRYQIADGVVSPVVTTPPPVPPSRVGGLDRAKNWALGAELSRPATTWSFDAPTPGETPGQDAVAGAIEALKPFAEALDAYGDDPRLDDMLSVGHAIHTSQITITGVSLGDLRRARTALASLRSTQADTGGESQTPAPAGDAVAAFEIEDARVDAALKVWRETHDTANVDDDPADLDHAAMSFALSAAIAQGPGAGQAGWHGIQADEDRIASWVTDRFGANSLNNPMERADRLLEEAIEMQQAVYSYHTTEPGQPRAEALLAHVYSKEPGNPQQEMGGVMTCALALGRRLGVRLDAAAQTELTRIEGLSKAHFDKRHQAKVDAGVAAQHERPTAASEGA